MNSLNDYIQGLKQSKQKINDSLTNKDIIIPNNTLLNNYSSYIDQIKLGTKSEEVSAKKENILIGTTTITADSNDKIVEGTMPNNGNYSSTINAGSSIILPVGYHNGNGIISVRSLAEETVGNATANKITSGGTGWVNGIQITGTMTVQSASGFSATALSSSSIRISWKNPSTGPWSGVKIRYSTSGYPGVSGGTLAYTGAGSNSSAGGTSYYDITGLAIGTTYYFTCISYCTGLGDGTSYNCSATTKGFLLYNYGTLASGARLSTSVTTAGTNSFSYKGGYWLSYDNTFNLGAYSTLNFLLTVTYMTQSYMNFRIRGNGDKVLAYKSYNSGSIYKKGEVTCTISYSLSFSGPFSIQTSNTSSSNSGTSGTVNGVVYKIWFE